MATAVNANSTTGTQHSASTLNSVATTDRACQPTEVLALALPVLAVGNSVAFVSVLQSRWFRGFFDPWSVPAAFLCFSIVLGGVCWLISRQVEGLYKRAATAGVVVCVVTSIVIAIVVVVAVLSGLVGSDDENESSTSRKLSRRRRSRRRKHRSRRRRY